MNKNYGSDESQFWVYEDGEKIIIADYGSGTIDFFESSIVGAEIEGFFQWIRKIAIKEQK